MKYEEALKELQGIVDKMENEQIGISELSKQIERSKQLLETCKNQLVSTKKSLSE